jgi:hypothetical protein
MALLCLHYSKYFEEKLLSGKIKGTILKGEWDIPFKEDLFLYIAPENVETSKEDKKVGTVKITSLKQMSVADLSDSEAKICGYENEKELKEGVKYWHKCSDSDIVTFIEFEFKSI